jgi:hypothetical protein
MKEAWISISVAMIALTSVPTVAHACGGFFCSGGGGAVQTPVVQAAERVIFEQEQDGTVRAYVQIRYDQVGGPPVGFSWIIPVQREPIVGIADEATFDELDTATAPQFRFVNNATSSSGGGACMGASAEDRATGASGGDSAEVPGVTVFDQMRVGDYETATLGTENAEELLIWLRANDFDIPEQAAELLDVYIEEGHLFVAFRYAPVGAGAGTLPPITLTYDGVKPCVPIRITAIATQEILDVMILAFGDQKAEPEPGYTTTEPDYAAVRPDFTMGTGTTYNTVVMNAISDAGGRAFVTEFAGPTSTLTGLTDPDAMSIAGRNAYVTRFYTRFTRDAMTVDPEFTFPGGDDVSRVHVIDLTPRITRTESSSSDARYAAAPIVLALGTLVVAARRGRRRR